MDGSLFDPYADQNRYRASTQVAAPTKTYCILFTPRSGSSWLTSILTQARTMGTPNEWFNPSHMPSSTRAKGARNLDQFVQAISRHKIHGGIFGFEITHHQINAVFGSSTSFMARFREATFFWLIRKDIVAQGISLDKMVQTRISHSASHKDSDIENSDDCYVYNSGRIRDWIRHILAAEIQSEKMISKFRLSPVRLSYEQNIEVGPQKVVELFAARLGLDLGNSVSNDVPSLHRKIGTPKNGEFAERFRSENRFFMRRIEAKRAKMLSHLI